MVKLDALLFIPNGIAVIELHFNNSQSGAGGTVDMTATPMSIELFPTNGSPQLIPFSGCGSGCNAPDLHYSPASATVTGSNKEIVTFVVDNAGDLTFDAVSLSSLIWTASPTGSCWGCGSAYLSRLTSEGNIYWDYAVEGDGTRVGSGNPLVLRSQLDLASGNTPIIMTFNNATSGTGAPVDMSIVDFDVSFTSSCSDFGPTQTVSFIASGGAASCSKCNLTYVGIVVSGNRDQMLQVNLTNNGEDCEITEIRITSTPTAADIQPFVELVRDNNETKWSGLASTAEGSETTMFLSNNLIVTRSDAIIDKFQFSNSNGTAKSIIGATMTIQFKINCCGGCDTVQEVTFTAN